MSDWLKKRAGKRLKQDALAPQTEKKGLLGLFHKPAANAAAEAQHTEAAAPPQQKRASCFRGSPCLLLYGLEKS